MHIHAFRRKEAITVDLLGVSVEFAPNGQGDVVAEVTDNEVAGRLLEIEEAYRPYEQPEQAADGAVDLGAMSAKQLRAFAKERGLDVPLGTSVPVADLREAIAKALPQG